MAEYNIRNAICLIKFKIKNINYQNSFDLNSIFLKSDYKCQLFESTLMSAMLYHRMIVGIAPDDETNVNFCHVVVQCSDHSYFLIFWSI